jgi:phage tail sheath protein FI
VDASGRGSWANDARVRIIGNPNFYDQETAEYSQFDVTVEVIDPATGLLQLVETYEAVELVDDEAMDYITKVVNDGSEAVVIRAVSGGIPDALKPVPFSNFLLGVGNGTLTTFSGVNSASATLAEGAVKIKLDAVQIGIDDGLGVFRSTSGIYSVSGTVDYESGAIAVFISPAPSSGVQVNVDGFKRPATTVEVILAGGSDGGQVTASDVTAVSLKSSKRGIYALDDLDEQMALDLPDYAGDPDTIRSLLTYAEGRGDIIVITQPPRGSSPQQAANFKRNVLRSVSSFGAMYAPWINVPDSLNRNRPKLIPPSGHVAGRYAFTDRTSNVGKAPAGITRGQLQFVSGLERQLSKTERDILYQAQINPIRTDQNVGVAIWGNKTLQIVGDFVEVNVRRLFIYLQKTQSVGLLDIVFEDIGPATFGLIKTRLDNFLEGLYLNNVIGSGVENKEQAFKVICDESNNPEPIQLSKRIVIDEFIKPNNAAEFIHLRLQRVFDASQL